METNIRTGEVYGSHGLDCENSVILKKSTNISEDPALSNIRVDDLIVEKFAKAVYYLTLPSDASSQFLVFFEYIAINSEASNTLF
jgi:hypothetical protein